MTSITSLTEYLSEATSWDADRRTQESRSRRCAWIVAGAALFTTCLTTTALLAMFPLQRVEPYVIRVDNTTGVVDVVPSYAGIGAPAEVLTRYLLTHYIGTCERFNLGTAEEDYSECGAFHSPQRNQQWAAQWATANPESPLNKFKDGTTVRVSVQSVSFFERASGRRDLAQVRFIKATRMAGTGPEVLSHWIATVHYAYGKSPSDTRVRQWNPLGFRVIDMQTDPELVEASTAAIAAGSRP